MTRRPPDARVFDALADQYRRHLLLALLESNPHDDDDLDPLDLLAAGETVDDREVTEVQLRHVHLPKLQAWGYIDWYPDTGEIATGENWAEIQPVVRLLRDHRDELPDGWP